VGPGYDGQPAPGPTPPLPHRGVEGSRSAGVSKVTPPGHALPPPPLGSQACRVGMLGRNSWTRPLLAPTPPRTVPTWASVARGGNLTQQDFTQQEAPAVAATPSDAIALYKRYVVMGYQARFSIKNNAGYEEINLFCRFPNPSATSAPPTQPLPTRKRQHR
jgi:hypothetical protein